MLALGLLAFTAGCSTGGGPTTLSLAAGDQASYEAAFRAARDELRDQGYLLDRVDVIAGVITTQRTGTPRDLADLAHRQQHSVRVTFTPPAAEEAEAPPGEGAFTSAAGGRTMQVRVIVDRIYRPGWRVPSSSSVRFSSVATNPELEARGLQPLYSTAIAEDRDLAAKLTADLAAHIGGTMASGQ